MPLVVSVHDVSYLEHPQYFTRFRAAQLKLTVKRTVQAAARVLTPSEFSRDAILRHYAIDERKVVVVPNAASSVFRPVERQVAAAAVERKYRNSRTVRADGRRSAAAQESSRLAARVRRCDARASAIAASAGICRQGNLVFEGIASRCDSEQQWPIASHFTGFVEDADLVHFYGACDLFVFPSFYEGFGLPILEGMACGRAVTCSNVTAMPEVADGAAILFDPNSSTEMARAMSDVLLDSELRMRLERLGTQRAAQFSWEQAARRTLDVYHEVAGAHRQYS